MTALTRTETDINKIIRDGSANIVYREVEKANPDAAVALMKQKQGAVIHLQDLIDKRIDKLADEQAGHKTELIREVITPGVTASGSGVRGNFRGLGKLNPFKSGPMDVANLKVQKAFMPERAVRRGLVMTTPLAKLTPRAIGAASDMSDKSQEGGSEPISMLDRIKDANQSYAKADLSKMPPMVRGEIPFEAPEVYDGVRVTKAAKVLIEDLSRGGDKVPHEIMSQIVENPRKWWKMYQDEGYQGLFKRVHGYDPYDTAEAFRRKAARFGKTPRELAADWQKRY